ncbi:MAG: hypothetical protein U5K69_04125 [Balneolaceae bacterium]|nr:hypothetical protein [Balneolaceae bacterium]
MTKQLSQWLCMATSLPVRGLDVFEEEPKIHPRLLSAPSCVMTPHIASATHKTRKAIGLLAANAIIRSFRRQTGSRNPEL